MAETDPETDPETDRPPLAGFGHRPTDFGWRADGDAERDPAWEVGALVPEAALTVPFAASVLSYGSGVMEGLKAERSADGRLLLFRVRDHAARFARSAERLLLLPLPPERFVAAVEAVVRANERHVPAAGEGALYVRPLEFCAEPMLGMRPGRQFTAALYGSPVGPPPRGPLARFLALDVSRAPAGGTGEAKAIVNYAGALLHKERARRDGFDDILFTADGAAQETTGTNVFCRLRSGALVTPALDGRFLGGITRDSVLRLARAEGLDVVERPLPVAEILDEGVELFCTGTGTGVRGVTALAWRGRERTFPDDEVTHRLRDRLQAIRSGASPDPFDWVTDVPAA